MPCGSNPQPPGTLAAISIFPRSRADVGTRDEWGTNFPIELWLSDPSWNTFFVDVDVCISIDVGQSELLAVEMVGNSHVVVTGVWICSSFHK